jgi:hypothetical protein
VFPLCGNPGVSTFGSLKEATQKPWVACPAQNALACLEKPLTCPSADGHGGLPQNALLQTAGRVGRKRCRTATVPARESAIGRSHFFYPPVFLHFPAFISNPLAPGPNLIPGGAAPPLSWGWGRATPPLGSHPESLIEGGVARMIPMKQNDIPALIVSTPGFGLAPCRAVGLACPGTVRYRACRSSRRLPVPRVIIPAPNQP